MAELPTIKVSLEEFGRKAGEYALDEFEYKGMTIREWADKITSGEYQPVRNGRLIEGKTFNDSRCSECGQVFRDDICFIYPYGENSVCKTPKRCPECGAFWDGDTE